VLPPDLFGNRVFSIASLVMALTFMGLMGASVFFPLFFQLVMGVSPSRSGMMTVAMMLGLMLSSMLNGRVLQRSARYKTMQLAGLAVAVASFAVLAWGMDSGQGYWVIEPVIYTLGMGLGLVMPNMTIVVQNALPMSRRGVGTAMLAFFRSLGGLLGVTGSGAILTWQIHAHGIETMALGGPHRATVPPAVKALTVEVYRHAIANMFAAGAVIVLAGFIALLFMPDLPLDGHPAVPPAPKAE
jgi:MFS family permease